MMRPDDLGKRLFANAMRGFVPSVERAARSIIHAATSPDVTPGGYYGPSGPGEFSGKPGIAKLAARAQNFELAARLWDVSEDLARIKFGP